MTFLLHTEDSCPLGSCRRCRVSPAPSAPKIPENPHDAAPRPQQAPGRLTLPPVADVASTVRLLLGDLESSKGARTWERVEAWSRWQMPRQWEPDDDAIAELRHAGRSDETIDRMLEDFQAGMYLDEVRSLCRKLDSATARLRRIIEISNPDRPKNIGTKDMQLAQVAAEGWCVSCFRDDQHLQPITTRPDGSPYYRDRCKPCGDYLAEQKQDKPIEMLRAHHEGRRVRMRTP